jgi:hypothetical protein
MRKFLIAPICRKNLQSCEKILKLLKIITPMPSKKCPTKKRTILTLRQFAY